MTTKKTGETVTLTSAGVETIVFVDKEKDTLKAQLAEITERLKVEREEHAADKAKAKAMVDELSARLVTEREEHAADKAKADAARKQAHFDQGLVTNAAKVAAADADEKRKSTEKVLDALQGKYAALEKEHDATVLELNEANTELNKLTANAQS